MSTVNPTLQAFSVHGVHSAAHSNAVITGLIYGLISTIGPDHLGTLITLSAATGPLRAFRVGGAWGLGHSVGMVAVAAIFLSVHGIIHIPVAKWVYYGNYLIGASLMLCAMYFMIEESKFVKQRPDGTFAAFPCCCSDGCTPNIQRPQRHFKQDKQGNKSSKFCDTFGCDENGNCATFGCIEKGEKTPLLQPLAHPSPPAPPPPPDPGSEQPSAEPALRSQETSPDMNWKGAVLGIFQGVCCPVGIVGLSFMVNLAPGELVCFIIVFLLTSAFGTAFLSMLWSYFTNSSDNANCCLPARTMYRASCGLTLVLGIVWMVGNYLGFLDRLDYAEQIQGSA